MTGLSAALLFLVVVIATSSVDAAIPNRDGQHGCIDCDISERQRCECREHLRRSGKNVAYICDPDSEDRFLVCHGPERVVCQNCAGGTKWNAVVGACGPVRKCDPFLCARQPSPVTPPPIIKTVIKEVIKHVPVIKHVTKEVPIVKEVIKQVPVIKHVTKEVPVIKEVIKHVPVIKHVTKEVPVVKEVIKHVPVIKPMPVEVIKYLPATTTPKPTTTTCAKTTTTPMPPPPPACDVYYEYHPEKMNWMSAKRVCEASQGTLATIPTMEVQSYIRERFGSSKKSKRFWLGANDRNREGSWEWVTGERFGFTNWYRSRPTYKRDYDCLQFNYGFGMWSDEDCSLNKPFLCQYIVCAKK